MRAGLLALIALVGALVVACGDDDDASPTITGWPSASVTLSPTHPPASTLDVEPTRVGSDEPRVVAAVSEAGFVEFAGRFEVGVEENSLEFFVQNARYMEIECGNPGAYMATSRNCLGQPGDLVVPAMPYGIWQSEGGLFSPEQFAEFIMGRLAGKDEPDAYVYALGHHVRGGDESDEGIDIVIAGVGSPPPGSEQRPGAALVFRVAAVDGEWAIVGVKIGGVELVDGFFDWWVPWDEVSFVEPSVCSGSIVGQLVLGYGDRGPAVGEWIQISGMPGDPLGNEKLVRTGEDGSFRVEGIPLGFHEGSARHASFDFTVETCGEVVELGTVEYPLIHP